ncbi:hypothetical protein SMD20_44295 [Nonomuraea sp. LP-02]|uniref:hypothetical protein n=1 Tax=Nonomuraea sp. LP-02 TaxID=3097960 RepID=UPI002E3419A4|nr:hypothetical protein [Nonomuraea sp. LP-02]MED7931306.1 hypothetical protein [Nonomuraea sp. LP-02]
MTGGAQEIEVKYRVFDLGALVSALAARGAALSPPVRQDAQAYAQPGWDYGQSKIGIVFARLRTQDGRHLFKPEAKSQACPLGQLLALE